MNSEGLAVFVQASLAGSVAAGARRLRISPLRAARRLAARERALGVRLLHRTTRAISLTPEGEAFLPHAQSVLDAEAAARESVGPGAGGVSGLLRVTTSAAFGRRVVAPLLAEFMSGHPDLRVDLILTDSVLDLVAEGVDLAIRIAHPSDSDLIGRRLADNRRGLYAAPAYLAGRRPVRCLADLADHECLTLAGAGRWPFRVGDRAVSQTVAGRFTASSVEGVHAACVAGLGVGLFSDWVVGEDVAEGRLAPVPLSDAVAEPLAIWALYPSRRLAPAKVTAFVDLLARRLPA